MGSTLNEHLKEQNIILGDQLDEFYERSYADAQQYKELQKVKAILVQYPLLIPAVLEMCGRYFTEYKEACKKRNDHLLREALGDAVHLLGLKRKPNHNIFVKHCIRIKEAIFKEGIDRTHHEGEKQFYKRYLKEDE